MATTPKRALALAGVLAALVSSEPAAAQGVFIPMPGSAPAATGPNAVNPSAAASEVDPNALNPNAAPSAVTTLNALNPNATPSTFAPQVTGPFGARTLIGPLDPLHGIVPGSGRRRTVRTRRTGVHPPAPARVPVTGDQRTRQILGSVCRGC